jgi:hypothetical protein
MVGVVVIGVRRGVSKGVEDGWRLPALQWATPETTFSGMACPNGVEGSGMVGPSRPANNGAIWQSNYQKKYQFVERNGGQDRKKNKEKNLKKVLLEIFYHRVLTREYLTESIYQRVSAREFLPENFCLRVSTKEFLLQSFGKLV